MFQHAGVAQGVRLDPGQVQELGHAVVLRPQQLGVDVRGDGRPLDHAEAVPGEEADLELLAPAQFGGRGDLKAAEGKDYASKQRTVEIVAYTGGLLMSQSDYGWDYPVVCDLEGFYLSQETFPLLDNHGPAFFSSEKLRNTVVGQANRAKVERSELKLYGGMFDNANAREIIDLAASAGEPELAVHGHAWGITAAAELGDRDALDRELAAYAALADELRQPRYRWYARSRQAMRCRRRQARGCSRQNGPSLHSHRKVTGTCFAQNMAVSCAYRKPRPF